MNKLITTVFVEQPQTWPRSTNSLLLTLQCNVVEYSVLQYNVLHYSWVQYSGVQYSAVKYSAADLWNIARSVIYVGFY